MAVDILVTGSSGVLGRQLVNNLRMSNYSVVACGRIAGDNTDAVWDISQQDTPEPDCNPSVVVHAAAMIGGYQQPFSEAVPLSNTNVMGTLRVANWCVSKKVQKLILISSAIVYGKWEDSPKSESDPVKPWLAGAYAVSKWCSEQIAYMVTYAGCQFTILRLCSLYGIGYDMGLIPRMLQEVQKKGVINLKPPFDDAFDLLHVSDAVLTVQCAIEKSQTGLWNVGGGKLTTIRELSEICAGQVDADVVLSETKSLRPARIINWIDDRRARNDLGHTNQTSLNIGISKISRSLLRPEEH